VHREATRNGVRFKLAIFSILAILAIALYGSQATAQTPGGAGGGQSATTSTDTVGAPEISAPTASLADPPTPTEEQAAQLAEAAARMNRTGPAPSTDGKAPASAGGGSESRFSTAADATSINPQVPAPYTDNSATVFRRTYPMMPNSRRSNVQEISIGENGRYAMMSGNWYGARSQDGGTTWGYVDPFVYPSSFPTFCCDQVVIFEPQRNIFIWLRMGIANASGQNQFKLSISNDAGFVDPWCTYSFNSSLFATTAGQQWYDYPHMATGGDYLYITWNLFNNSDVFQRSAILRMPLSSLHDCIGFSYNYYWNSAWFTFVPVAGAVHTMYFASNWPTSGAINSTLGIWRWPELGTAISFFSRVLPAWTSTTRGQATCSSGGDNWAARYDQRVLTGSRYSINNTNLQYHGRKVLGWWWNVQEGGSFPFPYINGAAFFEDTLALVPGNQGRPLMWNSTTCFAYPSVAPNYKQDLGIVFHYASGTNKYPHFGFGIADDYTPAPPGWTIYNGKSSLGMPSDDRWGDYNTVRQFFPTGKVWVGVGHWMPATGASGTANAARPVFIAFGRGRDGHSWLYWQNQP
jgi:hypothetical protein